MKRVLSFLGLFLSFAYLVTGQVITLDEAVRIGLEQNYDIRIMRNNQQISDRNVTWGNAGILPTVDVTSGYNLNNANARQTPADGSDQILSS